MSNNIDFIRARQKASELLMLQDSIDFPVDVEKLIIKDHTVIFSSYKSYDSVTGTKLSNMNYSGQSKDAMLITAKTGENVILYNSDITSSGRILWSKAHELGHLILNHCNQGNKEEVEADTFASQLLLPQCLLKALIRSNVPVTIDYIMTKFGLSKAAAQHCLYRLNSKLESDYSAEYDDIILTKCSDFLRKETMNNRYSSFYDDDISQEERDSWLY